MSEVFDLKGLGQLVSGIVILVYAWKKLALDFSFLIALNLLLNLIAASLIMIGLLIIAGATIFWTINSIFLMEIAYKFRDYARYPITIFNGFLRFIFTFIIPMAFISYYPSLAFLRPGNVPLFTWLCPVIGALFFVLSYFIWMKGASEYSGTGS
jgi:ABC-2 type transport system permease protein